MTLESVVVKLAGGFLLSIAIGGSCALAWKLLSSQEKIDKPQPMGQESMTTDVAGTTKEQVIQWCTFNNWICGSIPEVLMAFRTKYDTVVLSNDQFNQIYKSKKCAFSPEETCNKNET